VVARDELVGEHEIVVIGAAEAELGCRCCGAGVAAPGASVPELRRGLLSLRRIRAFVAATLYRAVIIDGTITLSECPVEGGVNSWLATHYFGRLGGREYEKTTAEENRKVGLSLITLEPARVRGFDNHRLIGRALRLYMRLREHVPLPADVVLSPGHRSGSPQE
jgi:hypothetical protein